MASIYFAGWGWLSLVFSGSLIVEVWPHLHYRYWQWRLDRRLARDAYMLTEELREFQLAQGEEPGRLDLKRAFLRSLRATFEIGFPVLMFGQFTHSDLLTVVFAAALLLTLIGHRRTVMREGPIPDDERRDVYPREAKVGFLVGMCAMIGIGLYLAL